MTSAQTQTNTQARSQAQAAVEGVSVKPTARVEYSSRGHVAILGGPEALEFAPSLQARHKTTVILTHGEETPSTNIISLAGRGLSIEGYLGNFTLSLGDAGKPNHETLKVDLVLDMGESPIVSMPLPPPGYLVCSSDHTSLDQAQAELAEMIGTFEKPRFFDYDASICAHARSGQAGCNRCVEACPADAITALAESIEVNPYLCQGGGVCASVCPSGAIRYVYPSASDMLNRIRALLQSYRQHDGVQPLLLFVAEDDVGLITDIPSNMLPVPVEEVASVGLDIWLSALAYSAQQVILFDSGKVFSRVRAALDEQLRTAAEVLRGLGYPADAIRWADAAQLNAECGAVMPTFQAATFGGLHEKRRAMFMALDHLFGAAPSPAAMVSLSVGAPFGSVHVDANSCTLCMSCTSVCPMHAVYAGNERPQLLFNESQCVQCGICAAACPEHSITLEARLLADPALRERTVTLHEEEPLACVSCGKPFATRSVVNNMLAKLEHHWMFQNERAKRRLQMCDDCRIADIVDDPEAMQQGFIATPRQ